MPMKKKDFRTDCASIFYAAEGEISAKLPSPAEVISFEAHDNPAGPPDVVINTGQVP